MSDLLIPTISVLNCMITGGIFLVIVLGYDFYKTVIKGKVVGVKE